MHTSWPKLCWQGARFCGDCLLSFCLWTVWLVLVALLALQLYIANARELTLPPFLLRAFEERLAASGMRVDFGRASFDPTGHVLLENVRFRLPTFSDPILTARSLHVTLDPWSLVIGLFEPSELHADGVDLLAPAMLSRTGRSESLVQDLSFTLVAGERELTFPQLTGRLATLSLTARGGLHLGAIRHDRGAPLPLAELLSVNYPIICRRLLEATDHLAVLDAPSAHLVFTPSETAGATLAIEVLAKGLNLNPALGVEATGLHARTSLPLFGTEPAATRVELTADELKLPQGIHATDARLLLRGRVNLATRHFDFRHIEASFHDLSGQGLTATDVTVHATPGPLSTVQAEITGRILGEPLAVQGTVNPLLRTAQVHAAGRFAPGLLDPLGRRLGHDLKPFVSFDAPISFDLTTGFDPGWRFTGVTGRVAATGVTAYHVKLDTLAGHVDFDGRRFLATDAIARLGTNFARGSFEQDFTTKEFRFLLDGQLRPPAIGGWFRDWWPNFWANFDFTRAAPVANVDVHGWWGQGNHTTVFVFADCTQPAIRGVPLDHAITRIFVRPGYYDALEIFVTRNSGAARGWFTRSMTADFEPLSMAFDFDSTLELATAAGLVGPDLTEVLEPFVFVNSPPLKVHGIIDGLAAPGGEHRRIHVEGHTTGPFTFHRFPLLNLSFVADLKDDMIVVSPLEVGFANGVAQGLIRLAGPANARTLSFDLGIAQANLREAVTTLEKFAAARRNQPAPAASGYIERTASVNFDLSIAANGLLDDPYSFTGSGHAELAGQGLGKIRLLGLLSELLNFTALRFDTLRTDFTVEQTKLVFPNLSLTGPNAAIDAHGSYLLKPRELDFNARVYPFSESKFILKSVVGAVLTPLSTILEVKLGGSLDNPSWAFVIGPTNFLRSIFAPNVNKPDVIEPTATPLATPAEPSPASTPTPVPQVTAP